MEFSGQERAEFKGSKTGRLFLTTHRMIFNNQDHKNLLLSFSFPFSAVNDVRLGRCHSVWLCNRHCSHIPTRSNWNSPCSEPTIWKAKSEPSRMVDGSAKPSSSFTLNTEALSNTDRRYYKLPQSVFHILSVIVLFVREVWTDKICNLFSQTSFPVSPSSSSLPSAIWTVAPGSSTSIRRSQWRLLRLGSTDLLLPANSSRYRWTLKICQL